MITISDEMINESLGRYLPTIPVDLCLKIGIYVSLLIHWNKKISLTNITDPLEIIQFHFGESLFAISNVPIEHGRLADVGSGPGFPGLPLKLAVPSLHVVLIESNGRKAAFLSEVIRELKLGGVEVFRGRMENFRAQTSKLDFATARALGQADELLAWSRQQLAPNGKLVLWLGSDHSERLRLENEWNWRDPIRIPGSQRRYLLIGSPRL